MDAKSLSRDFLLSLPEINTIHRSVSHRVRFTAPLFMNGNTLNRPRRGWTEYDNRSHTEFLTLPVGWTFTFAAAVRELVRIRNLMAAPA